MKPLPLSTVAELAGGALLRGPSARLVSRVSTDSRTVAADEVFVALCGDRFDGHDFAAQAAAGGAAAVVVSKRLTGLPEGCGVILVDDTLRALQQLAAAYRSWHGYYLVGITGSNGKTSTKDFCQAVFSAWSQTRATAGNLNNHIGLPLTLLSAGSGDECVIAEMGMNHAGEIAALAAIAQPDAAILTNCGTAHIEHLGSRENIAWEKASLPARVPAGGVVVLNANDEYSARIARLCQARVILAGTETGDVAAVNLRPHDSGTRFDLDFGGERVETELPVRGAHMVGNAALAAAAAWGRGLRPEEIAGALRGARLTGGRLQPQEARGVRFLDDSYNANPDSMAAGLRTLMEGAASRRFAVLGPMGELGDLAEEGHRGVGRLAARLGVDGLLVVGGQGAEWMLEAALETAPELPGGHFADHESCAVRLRELARPGDLVLVKGSRAARMERVIEFFGKS
jgi:UDP-N-acetylmuramoyl-tripeptide--D-alanyl-D-alanine ligase